MIRGQNLFLDPKAILTDQWLISLSSRGCKVGAVEPNKDGGLCGANYLIFSWCNVLLRSARRGGSVVSASDVGPEGRDSRCIHVLRKNT